MSNDFSRVVKLIPTYNEKDNVAFLAEAIFDLYPKSSVLVLDDNSPDGTALAVENLQKKFPRLFLCRRSGPRGFGRSYLEGFRKILTDPCYEYLVMMDADFSHNPVAISAMVNKLSDSDLVIGSRYVKGGRIENWKRPRRILSRFANFYARTILGAPIRDLTTGFMCFKKSLLDNINLDSIKSDGYAFLVELKYRLWKAGAKIVEHPIVFSERREGQSKMSWKVIWESIWLPWKLRGNNIRYKTAKKPSLLTRR